VIHSVNGITAIGLDGLRSAVDKLKPNDPVAMQITDVPRLRDGMSRGIVNLNCELRNPTPALRTGAPANGH
jgi:hypothetical protein